MAKLRIRQLARAQGLNITTLSRKAEIAYTTAYALWHDRLTQFHHDVLERTARALGVAVRDLFATDERHTITLFGLDGALGNSLRTDIALLDYLLWPYTPRGSHLYTGERIGPRACWSASMASHWIPGT